MIAPKKQTYLHSGFYTEVAVQESERLYQMLDTTPKGLSEDVTEERLKKFGHNEIAHEKYQWQRQLLSAFLNPFNILLSCLSLVSYLTDDTRGAIVMGAMVLISGFLTFFQEFRSSRAAEKLKAMVSTHATVIRNSSLPMEIPLSQIVPGDLVQLSAGDMIPADLRLISSKDLFVSQSSLTGESVPVEKFSAPETEKRDLAELKNICFMGTNIVSGTAQGVVLKTGRDTYLGSMANSFIGRRVQTSFDKGIDRFTWLMLRFMFVMVPMVFLINGFAKGQWFDAFMFAIAVAVGLTPEMLPMIVTVNLAKGALAMAKKKVIVKRLNSIQNFGAIDVLCTDKTGTLTQDRVVLEKYVDPFGNAKNRVLRYAYLNSFYQTGLKNLLDVAILKHNEIHGELGVERNYKKIDEIPFDFSRKRMSVVVGRQNATHVLICKGALEEIFNLCSLADIDGKMVPIKDVPKDRCHKYAQDLNDDGLRVIAVAYKEVPSQRFSYSVQDEHDLILLGFVAFYDPPKETASQAIRLLSQKGVAVKVLTGDNDRVTRKICKEVGLNADSLLLGSEIDNLSDQDLDLKVESTSVFAKLTPMQKSRIVQSLHRCGHVVGFMGDGINDAPALKIADIGISVDNAVDIAKESADIILLEKSLLVLEEGIIEGRKVFGNIIKYIKMGASSNFGNVFSVLGSSALLPFLPMRPVQLLTQNLLYDLSQTAIPLDNVDEEYLEKPRKWEIGDIGRFMIVIGPLSSIFDYATFALMLYFFKANSVAHQGLFQSGWFVEGLLSQTLIVHMIRTPKIPFLQSRASTALTAMTVLIMMIGLVIPFTDFGSSLGLERLPWAYFPWLIIFLIGYCCLTQFVKSWFVKKYGFN